MYELNLPEFIVIYKEIEKDKLIFYIKPKNLPVSCINCGGTIHKHAAVKRYAKDINIDNKKVKLVINTNRFKCSECEHTFTQQFESIDYRDKITKRLIAYIVLEAKEKSLSQIASELGLAVSTIKRASDSRIRF